MYANTCRNDKEEQTSSSKYETLCKYHQYIEKQMECLRVETEKDQAELDLLQLNVCESIMALSEKRDLMIKELERLEGQQISEKEYGLEIEAENVQKIMVLKEECGIQQRLRKEQRNLRDIAHSLMVQTKSVAQKMDPNNIQTGIYGIIAEIQLQLKQKQQQHTIIDQNIKHLKNEQMRMLEFIRIKQQQSASIREEIEKMTIQNEEKEHQIQLNEKEKQEFVEKNQFLKAFLEQIKKKCEQAGQKYEKSYDIERKMSRQKDILMYQLETTLKNLEVEERGRQADQQKYNKNLIDIENNKDFLHGLQMYVQQLKYANEKYQNIINHQHKPLKNNDQQILKLRRVNSNSQSVMTQMNKRPTSSSKKDSCKDDQRGKQNTQTYSRVKRSTTSSTLNTNFISQKQRLHIV